METAYQELWNNVRLRKDPEEIQRDLDKYILARQKVIDYQKGLSRGERR